MSLGKQRTQEIREHLDGLLPSLGWEKVSDNPPEYRTVQELTYREQARVFTVRVIVVGQRCKFQAMSNGVWLTRTVCLLSDVIVGKGYTRIGSEFVHH